MSAQAILQPMFSLVLLTYVVLLAIPFVRVRAVQAKTINVNDFKLGESARVPDWVSLPNRNYMNLLELPTLFYAACLTLYITEQVDQTAVTLAWAYVGMRVVHSAIHLTYNNVLHRLFAFAASNVVLSLVWLRLFLQLG